MSRGIRIVEEEEEEEKYEYSVLDLQKEKMRKLPRQNLPSSRERFSTCSCIFFDDRKIRK